MFNMYCLSTLSLFVRKRVEKSLSWDNKNVLLTVRNSKFHFMHGPLPGVWHNLCILNNCRNNNQKIVLDGELALEVTDIDCEKYQLDENIKITGHFGSLTDFNIWSKVLSNDEIHSWNGFDEMASGDVVKWDDASVQLYDHVQEDISNKKLIAMFAENHMYHILDIQAKKSFDDSIDMCHNMGGELAVPTDNVKMSEFMEV